jgi:hypothetical protein
MDLTIPFIEEDSSRRHWVGGGMGGDRFFQFIESLKKHKVEEMSGFEISVRGSAGFCRDNIKFVRRHSQVVRQRSAKPPSPSSNLGAAF